MALDGLHLDQGTMYNYVSQLEMVLSSGSGSVLLMKPFMDTQNLPSVSEQGYINILLQPSALMYF